MHSIVQSRIPIPSQFSRRILNTCAHEKEVGACRRSRDDFFVHLEDVHGVPRRVIVPLLDGDFAGLDAMLGLIPRPHYVAEPARPAAERALLPRSNWPDATVA